MTDISEFAKRVEPDIGRPGRYRWNIVKDGSVRDRSVYSFATRREAEADAERFLEKLNITWTPRS